MSYKRGGGVNLCKNNFEDRKKAFKFAKNYKTK